ncbi:MAG: hypothetical protein KC656_09055 [Myxococcales bacterium]|nr:hypothetical protein [Myxococcales bacterium]
MDPRHALLTFLFAHSWRPWAWLKRREPWGLSPLELARWPPGTLGEALGRYLCAMGFELMDKLESHDVAHLLTGVATDVPGEIALQYLLAGNGKRSVYMAAVLVVGAVLFPERHREWRAAFARGRELAPFHHLDFRALLDAPLGELVDYLEGRRAAA